MTARATPDFVTQYRKYGPLLYSHFFRRLGEENRAMKATRYAFAKLLTLNLNLKDERVVVRWVRECEVPADVAQSESLW